MAHNFVRRENVNGIGANLTASSPDQQWSVDRMHVHFGTGIEARESEQVDLKNGKAAGDAAVKSGSQPQLALAQSLTPAGIPNIPAHFQSQTKITKEL